MKPNRLQNVSTHQIEAEIKRRFRMVGRLQAKRDRLRRLLNGVDRRILALGKAVGIRNKADGGRSPRKRLKNRMTLAEAIFRVLKGKKAMPVAKIVKGVKKSEYRTTSKNLAGLVRQVLFKDRRFRNAGWGIYSLG